MIYTLKSLLAMGRHVIQKWFEVTTGDFKKFNAMVELSIGGNHYSPKTNLRLTIAMIVFILNFFLYT